MPNPEVTITLTDGGVIKLELYPSVAPNTVANFVNLIESGFYDGLTFHRVIAGFMIQGGDPLGNGTGGPDYTILGEFSANGVENNLSHTRGVLSMARSSDYNSAGSQFFIMHGNATYLDGEYAAFGKIIGEDTPDNESYATLDRIANTATDANDRPNIDYVIESMTVDTKGYKYTVVKYEE
ncbi:MAG TPA: peptidylprolyl isomerase [Candidatus Excrementavichristensenella intestinipullorum]|nr:peptidylprolyl isomerase [Candidatus Excrementavichristensenella intestinipullorum]